ncbi:glycoside hydrolase family 43 protein [Bifidobacterium simiiventris]|uniref:glycoside hydrolase family 43 protein n=1 Tax=Bifidobacterium simiiventris TaxID=2834434 RepID=UPI001C58A322|nr:glycoside hydrolase family 43 protein [Bifidobacterium simiiventris]MBW3079417.1 glycoside hydrolase family 43 protein [Bifidobacterium simiiventris]
MTQPYEAYVWAYFTGDTGGNEQISLAVSRGNDALNWQTLNGGRPLLTSAFGTRGLRDPFITRSHDDSRFYIIATDLNVAALHGNFREAQCNGSQYLEIWESDDLVHWGEQRHTLVSAPNAGNTWAPETYWVPELGEYAVYWSSNLYPTATDRSAASSSESAKLDSAHMTADEIAAAQSARELPTYGRMMIATTKDFRTFSQPRVWMDVCRGNGHDGLGLIDATVTHDGDWWYRFVKDEKLMTVREERSHDLMATVSGSLPGEAGAAASGDGWQLIRENVGVGLPNGETDADGTAKPFTHGEGPCIFRANDGDVNGYRWFLFIDQPRYHGGPNHYIGFATQDLADPDGWVPVSGKLREGIPINADGGKPRHGTVMPITAAERDRLLAAFGD